ncbi:HD domain-containing protein [Runella salmonicolor]|uniref:HD-CE domain-containing protein n=1 Tax=Runella salmonicolor TaxID=2950278 RepID=A0ABT1FWG9_9BACT|nr:hypothetical protein [Runella salmonicolor]MCP1384812.1 hypothetical protein [Runella salmonicolor]
MNIQTEFLKFKTEKHEFPHGKDYTKIYEDFKEDFDKNVHPEVKTKILEIEKEGYYNDHGVDHIAMVIERVSRIMECMDPKFTFDIKTKNYITPYELFILLMAIQLHDTGHLIASRAEHAKAAKELLAKFDRNNKLSTAEKTLIGNIAQAHGGKNDPIDKLYQTMHLSHQTIRPQLLAAFLRLGDELAEDETRASKFLLEIDKILPTSIIYHLYSASLNSLQLNGREISLIFYITDTYLENEYKVKKGNNIIDQYLINEIYDRTQKTLLESLYCSRYLPDECRFTKVKVKINLVKEKDHDEIAPPIAYELKENGYPLLGSSDIYSICDTLWISSVKIDGEYISKIIKKKNEKSI